VSAISYHDGLSDLEGFLVDVCRMGAVGDSGGVRAAARRLIRKTPREVSDPERFRQAIGAVLAGAAIASRSTMLRHASADDVPVDGETAFALATVVMAPEARPVLRGDVSQAIEEVIAERERLEELAAAGVKPSRAVLMTGPPGVGKTMTARYVATRLGLPLVTIDLASVMSSYLGRTGQNLRAALSYGREHACVVFVDEFDALAKRRDDDSDIGELKRLVNVLLLELERWPSSTLLLAATNHPELLDRAMARRFDLVIDMDLPDAERRRALLVARLADEGRSVPNDVIDLIADLTDGSSGSDIERMVTAASRKAVLQDLPLAESLLAQAAALTGKASRQDRDRLCRLVSERLGWSNRRIAALLGVSHPTVAAAVSRARRG
jgi:MoxR-like ATPase